MSPEKSHSGMTEIDAPVAAKTDVNRLDRQIAARNGHRTPRRRRQRLRGIDEPSHDRCAAIPGDARGERAGRLAVPAARAQRPPSTVRAVPRAGPKSLIVPRRRDLQCRPDVYRGHWPQRDSS
jgi:hypothetical protein